MNYLFHKVCQKLCPNHLLASTMKTMTIEVTYPDLLSKFDEHFGRLMVTKEQARKVEEITTAIAQYSGFIPSV